MAQSDQRPRHVRQSSKIPRFGNSGDHDHREWRTTEKLKPSDEATVKYIKRVLCAQSLPLGPPGDSTQSETDAKPLDELLPPLTSSNAVDLQLYAIIAVILNQFVQSWYNRITPDQDFVGEVVQIIAHCTRGLEQRLRMIDLEELLLDDLPALMTAHIDAVHVAQSTFSTHHRSEDEVRLIYHTIHPNKALTPLPEDPSTILEQQDNEIAWAQLLVSQVLPLVLPPEDLHNPCLHVLVSELFSDMIVHNAVCGKASEAWLIWEGVTKLIRALRPDLNPQTPADDSPSSINKLEQFGLLSSAKIADKQELRRARGGRLDLIAQVFWTTLQVMMTVWLLLRSFAIALMHASSIPARAGRVGKAATSDKVRVSAVVPDSRPSPQHTILTSSEKRPVVKMQAWTCISRLTAIERRMPWLSGLLSLMQWLSLYGPGGLCKTNSTLDRLISAQFNARLRRPALLPSVLQAIRGALFPDNALAAARVPPTSAEAAEIKRECANTIIEVIPKIIRIRYFGTADLELARQDVEGTLELFADSYINKHLIISAVELIVVRLFPELGDDYENE